MANIRGKTGIINKTGIAGSSATLVDCRSIDFMSNIEDGICSTVETLVAAGYHTVSSCEGHIDSYPLRCVSIIENKITVDKIIHFICNLNKTNKWFHPIRFIVYSPNPGFNLYSDCDFIEPSIINICFGNYNDYKTNVKQDIFNKGIKSINNQCYPLKSISQKEISEYIFKGNHTDEFM